MSSQVTEHVTADERPQGLFTADDVAAALQISKTLVRQLTIGGAIPCRRIGRLVRYTQSDVNVFINSKEAHPFR